MSKFDDIRKWYSGKSRSVLDEMVLPTLRAAEERGCWGKGESRKVLAALSKANEAAKFAHAHDRVDSYSKRSKNADGLLHSIKEDPSAYSGIGGDLVHAMMFNSFLQAPELARRAGDFEDRKLSPEARAVFRRAYQWAEDFIPVAELINDLNASRPAPTFVMGTLSPTVAKTLTGAGLTLRPETRRVPQIEWRWVEKVEKGQRVRYKIGTIKWPKGTRHNQSRFAVGTSQNLQCHACGHAIKNAYNWVPLLFDDASGVPHSFWVGRDCAHKLFGVEVEGDGTYEGR